MGRGKLVLRFIANDRSRKMTFKKRKEGLLKKAEELSILCDIDTCVVIHSPDDDSGRGPAVWPHDPEKVKQVIDRYFDESVDRRKRHATGLREFYMRRKQNLEKELGKVRPTNWAAKFPVSDELLNGLSQDELLSLPSVLRPKLESVKKRLLAAKENAGRSTSRMDPLQMEQLNGSMMCHPVWGSSASNSSSTTIGNHQNNDNRCCYNYPFTVPTYDASFPQSSSLSTRQTGTRPLDQYNQMSGRLPAPENPMLNCSGEDMLGNASSGLGSSLSCEKMASITSGHQPASLRIITDGVTFAHETHPYVYGAAILLDSWDRVLWVAVTSCFGSHPLLAEGIGCRLGLQLASAYPGEPALLITGSQTLVAAVQPGAPQPLALSGVNSDIIHLLRSLPLLSCVCMPRKYVELAHQLCMLAGQLGVCGFWSADDLPSAMRSLFSVL
ncbi:developmental protein SEPALLATA 2-like [Punica granatum]|uniref:MADS-box domain-containing protein n=2 Tax=Punica granatum TaxID=22663 RepID=A0A218XIX1_PUNGR|nr:developmental protein SEPALLATA 2-like [Punica granatum]OWM84748.1 hypothetical protein CDL15_Pgr027535 [Punica granatum]PKI69818.1 hypothetical protein CRG98_009693 [Punica granatum]